MAMIIADILSLKHAVAAGVIAILSTQSTRRQSVEIAIQRICSSLLALTIASIIFWLLGYSPITFGLYLLIFIPSAVKLKVSEGIVVSSVLVTHLLVENSIEPSWLLNELLLMLIGAGVALILKLICPA